MADTLNMEQRDPNSINNHLKAVWEDVIAEPDGTHSIDGCWKCSFKCYTGAKECCYKFLSAIAGWLLACCWGFCFAYLSFCQIWMFTPCIKCYTLQLGSLKMCLNSVINTFCVPWCEACSRCLGDIKVTTIQG